ncbi:MAG: hypothetical protein ACXWP0_01145 [Ktedonobacterales bacterium]
MRLLPPDKTDGLPQEGDRNFQAYMDRMRALLNTRVKALTTRDPIPLHTIIAYRFVPRPHSSSVRLQVQLEDCQEHILEGGAALHKIADHGLLPDPRKASPGDVRHDGPWMAYYPQLFAIPKS